METITKRKSLGEILVAEGVITRKQLEVAVHEQRRRRGRLGVILVETGFCSEEAISEAIARQLALEFKRVLPEDADSEAIRRIGPAFLKDNVLVPLNVENGVRRLAMLDPLNLEAIDQVQVHLKGPVDVVVSTRKDILVAISTAETQMSRLDAMLDQHDPELAQRQDRSTGKTQVMATLGLPAQKDVSAEELAREIIANAVKLGAADVHVEPEERVCRVRYRVDGILMNGAIVPLDLASALVARIKVIANLNITEKRLPQDGRAQMTIDDQPIDLRVSCLPIRHGESVVMRILDRRRAQVPFGRLGLAEWILDPVKRIMERPHGIFLVTGPTGSGKSTTLYAMLSLVNALESKVITVEDPVEYELPLIRQCQVNPEIGLTFAAGLRSILRQDPDVIMVGEIRDKETAEIAIRAALTGHLVLSTLHTNTAIGALSRLTDMGIDPFLVNSTLAGVLAQRLIRVLCKKCKSKRPATKEEIERFHQETRSRVKDLYAAIGCAACGGTGYSGRTGIHELFLLDDRIRKLVAAGRPEEELLQAAEAAGFKDLHRSGEEKVLRGETTIEEVGRVALSGH